MPEQKPTDTSCLMNLIVGIFILAIAYALLVPTIGPGPFYRPSTDARIGLEISNLAQAIEKFRMDIGSYPPDFRDTDKNDRTAIDEFLPRRFRLRTSDDRYTPSNLDPAEALVFWLRGFGDDPTKPLVGTKSNPFFEFDLSRLRDQDGDGHQEYYPTNKDAPFIYFLVKHEAGTLNEIAKHPPLAILNGLRQASPYQINAEVRQDSADGQPQIISAGRDDDYGAGGVFPDGIGYAEGDKDNIANFSSAKTLQDCIP